MSVPETAGSISVGSRVLRVTLAAVIGTSLIASVSCSNLFGDQFDTPSGLKSEAAAAESTAREPLEMVRYTPDELEAAIRAGAFESPRDAELKALVKLTEVFYGRLMDRRINSIATFHDPALREFFRNAEMFADYYADLVQSLTESRFEDVRPDRVGVEALLIIEAGRRVTVQIRFRGENALPLRWWSVYNTREDEWEYALGQWWIVPRKL